MVNIDIYIASGGKSSRMGRDKGMIRIKGKAMVAHLADMLLQNGFECTIIANSYIYNDLDYRIIRDVCPNKGPMGALHTALTDTKSEWVMLLSCDTPFFPAEAVKRLIENCDDDEITILRVHRKLYPLQACYHKSLSTKVLSCIENDELKMRDLVESSEVRYVDMEDLVCFNPIGFANFNEPKDVEKWIV